MEEEVDDADEHETERLLLLPPLLLEVLVEEKDDEMYSGSPSSGIVEMVGSDDRDVRDG